MQFLLFFIPIFVFANSPFESLQNTQNWDFSAFNTDIFNPKKESLQSSKVKCRTVCDKKISHDEVLTNALSFYKNSKLYGFAR